MLRTRFALLALVAPLALLGPTPDPGVAAAAPAPAPVEVTLGLTATSRALTGFVSSDRPRCRAGRGVRLSYRDPRSAAYVLVRTATSGPRGGWRVAAPRRRGATVPPGSYVVRIPASPTCRAAVSRPLTVRD